MLCDDPSEGIGAMGGRLKGEGIYVYIQLIYFVVQQKLLQHCKAIMLHKKKRGAENSVIKINHIFIEIFKI